MTGECIVKTENLTRTFGSITAVKDLSIEINRGQVFGFLGPNGSGKTTTISMMLGLINPTKGNVNLFGTKLCPDSLKRVGTVMDTNGFYPGFSARDNLLIFGSLHKPADRKKIDASLEMVGLASRARSKFHTYSMGMKQRLSIALALLDDPEFFIFDEPTNGMDPEGIAEIRSLIVKLASQGKTVFLASHLLSEVEQVCTHLAILKKGVVIRQGSLTELLSKDNRGELEVVPSDFDKALSVLKDAGYETRIEKSSLIVKVHEGDAEKISVLLVTGGVPIREMRLSKPRLEDVFIEATGQN
ncbi:ABC transporter ATP-binding protein [Dehalogenimonas etheniformans]|uniref:ABC transporter ATP-binding protein n=1 Tax=Dehalogenimonas etheniformans TaxID=1536648 RepID=A0A2P5P5D1_9CHLR|nr:ABC transporter ATP-binding protein [Dehalogenimonas etheniformans]PPD57509.1 ABC transporter ATP-binding protein [Dehalogenimonas etheniformans]QNT76871.1 ABC transporter ATP-binding protein [Dehalogenimonas etheniformans]